MMHDTDLQQLTAERLSTWPAVRWRRGSRRSENLSDAKAEIAKEIARNSRG